MSILESKQSFTGRAVKDESVDHLKMELAGDIVVNFILALLGCLLDEKIMFFFLAMASFGLLHLALVESLDRGQHKWFYSRFIQAMTWFALGVATANIMMLFESILRCGQWIIEEVAKAFKGEQK